VVNQPVTSKIVLPGMTSLQHAAPARSAQQDHKQLHATQSSVSAHPEFVLNRMLSQTAEGIMAAASLGRTRHTMAKQRARETDPMAGLYLSACSLIRPRQQLRRSIINA